MEFNDKQTSDVTFVLKEGIFSETGTNELYAHKQQLQRYDWFKGLLCNDRIEVDRDISRMVYFIYEGPVWSPDHLLVDLHLADEMNLEVFETMFLEGEPFDTVDEALSCYVPLMCVDDIKLRAAFDFIMSSQIEIEVLDGIIRVWLGRDVKDITSCAMNVLFQRVNDVMVSLPQNFVRLYNEWSNRTGNSIAAIAQCKISNRPTLGGGRYDTDVIAEDISAL